MKKWICLLGIVVLTVLLLSCEGNQVKNDDVSESVIKD